MSINDFNGGGLSTDITPTATWHRRYNEGVVVLRKYGADDYRCGERTHKSLTAAAKAVTGNKSISGPRFWGDPITEESAPLAPNSGIGSEPEAKPNPNKPGLARPDNTLVPIGPNLATLATHEGDQEEVDEAAVVLDGLGFTTTESQVDALKPYVDDLDRARKADATTIGEHLKKDLLRTIGGVIWRGCALLALKDRVAGRKKSWEAFCNENRDALGLGKSQIRKHIKVYRWYAGLLDPAIDSPTVDRLTQSGGVEGAYTALKTAEQKAGKAPKKASRTSKSSQSSSSGTDDATTATNAGDDSSEAAADSGAGEVVALPQSLSACADKDDAPPDDRESEADRVQRESEDIIEAAAQEIEETLRKLRDPKGVALDVIRRVAKKAELRGEWVPASP